VRAGGEPSAWAKELDDVGRGLSGAALFGMPLLFTMEMWWLGADATTGQLFGALALALGANTALAHFSGFKHDSPLHHSVAEAVEAVALGAVASLVVLLVLGQIEADEPLRGIVGKVVVQAVPLSLGASVANALFSRGGREFEDENGEPPSGGFLHLTLLDVGATVAGGLLIGFSIAPTEEVALLAAELDLTHQLALIALSLAVTYAVVFESGFDPMSKGSKTHGPFQSPVTETALAYAVSLAVSFVVLRLFGFATDEPLGNVVAQVLVLGLPTAIGGAAGRIAA
jgi:putative integral membrane protein (TIGR02587 family)